jgi:hypothetical protein
VLTLVQGGASGVDTSSLAIVNPAPANDASSTVSASSSHGYITTTLATTGGTVNATGPFSLTFGYCAPGDATYSTGDPNCSTGTLTYDPSRSQNMGDELKILGFVTEDIYEDAAIASVQPATVAHGQTFTITNAPVASAIPASDDGFTVNYADTFAAVVPVPSGLTYVPGSIKVTGGDSFTAGKASGTYCTAAGTGCDAQINTGNYKTAYPYIELELPSSDQVAGGNNVSMPTLSAQFTATGAPGTVEPVDLTEFKVDTNVSTAGNVNFDGYPTTGSSGTPPYAAPTPLSTTTIVADQAPSITSSATTTFTAGTAGSFTVTASGAPTPSLSESGALPSGVTFVDNGNGTASLSGTPATGSGGNYPITITASNGTSPNASQSFTLTVDSAPAITSAASTTFVAGSSGSFTITTSGTPAAALSETGSLPAGVSFVDNGNGTATLSGTAAASGVYPFSITASNGVSPNASQSFTLTVETAPSITSASSTTFVAGSSGELTVTTQGLPTASLSESGVLPTGVTFTDNGDGTATLAGTPTAGGSYPITITASNGVSPNASQPFTLTVDSAPAITSGGSATFTESVDSSFTVVSTGTPTPSLSETGSLPSGLSFNDNGDGTATLSGTPADGSSGTYLVAVTASNGVGEAATQDLTITVNTTAVAPSFTSGTSTTFLVGSAGSFTVTTTGNPPPNLHESGDLPTGVSFTDNGDGTATLAGTPAVGSGGVYPVTLSASNGVDGTLHQSFTLTVDEPPTITSPSATTFHIGSSGHFTVTTTGTPVANISESGVLPGGVSFTDNGDGTATLAGTPVAGSGGTYDLQISADNGVGDPAAQTLTLTVNAAPAITSAAADTFTAGTPGSFTVTSTGSPTPALAVTGTLPTGVNFTDNGDGTGTLSGTPSSGGVFPLTVTASNGVGTPSTQHFVLTVDAVPQITTAATTTFVVHARGTFTVSTTGYPTASLTESGALPAGISFAAHGNGTATLSGTPAAGTAGSYSIDLSADNGVGTPASQPFTLIVDQAPAFTSADATTFELASNGSFPVTTTGFPTPSVIEWGTLPVGVTFNGSVLSGKPETSGTYDIGFIATNGVGNGAVQDFTLTVGGLQVTTTSLPALTEGVAYSQQLTATGGIGDLKWKKTAALPKGLKLSKSGLLSGTVRTTVASGSYTIAVQVTDSSPKPHQVAQASLTLAVSP